MITNGYQISIYYGPGEKSKYANFCQTLLYFINNTSLAAQGALANRLQRRTDCKTQNGHQGAAKWPMWSGNGSNYEEHR